MHTTGSRQKKVISASRLLAAGLLCAWATSWANAQEAVPKQRLVSFQEGRVIAGVAQDPDQSFEDARDCSHLVHQIYKRAGFEYPYSSSYDLYTGAEKFQRVRVPQVGDVIVWPGHVGIVLDPGAHSFYSLVRRGVQANDYNAPYWKARGKPHFLRYVLNGRGATLTTARVQSGKSPKNSATIAEEREVDDDTSPESASARTASSRAPVYGPVKERVNLPYRAPASILLGRGKKAPTIEEAAQGISELTDASGGVLRASDPLHIGQPVVIYDRLSVERIEMKRDHGWAHVVIESKLSFAGTEKETAPRSEQVAWEIRKTTQGWEAVAPLDRAFVPRDVAVRAMSARLAQVSQSEEVAERKDAVVQEQARLAELLKDLLEKK